MMTRMKPERIVCIPGNGGGGGSDGWFAYIKHTMETEEGIPCITDPMPDPVLARASVWLPHMEETLHVDASTLLIGHSSGAIAAMRYTETHRVAGLILIGTYHTDLGDADEQASGYFNTPWEWEHIKSNIGRAGTTVFASEDDPYIPITEPRHVAESLDAYLYELYGEGHFVGNPYGTKTEFPELLHVLRSKTH